MSSDASNVQRHQPQTTKSFSRYEPTKRKPASRSRASSLQDPLAENVESPVEALLESSRPEKVENSIFERQDSDDNNGAAEEDMDGTFAEGYDDLPIEIQSLMERFLESLSAKVHPTPLSIERLSDLYQDFYVHVEPQIGTHIAALQSKIFRDNSPAPSVSSTGSSRSRGMRGPNSPAKQSSTDDFKATQQMLTASEVTGKRKVRRQMELRKLALEEAVERGVCEKVYPRLWRHKSTDDEERDERLRSRAASLSVINIGLRELLSTAVSPTAQEVTHGAAQENEVARSQLTEARNSLRAMNDDRYPLGKLRHLTAVHKNIVDVLSHMFPSSSADEVLPTLIYTIITSDPESLHIGSNFNFIRRFRAQSKLDGEAAYCLTNLEAAIAFLDNVDIASIRPDERESAKSSSRASTPRAETPNPLYRGLPGASPNPNNATPKSPSSPKHARRFSTMASDVVIQSADTTFNTIHGALDGSFKFFFGRLREQQAASPHNSPSLAAPATLEDARKLVSTPPPVDEEEKGETSSINELEDTEHGETSTKVDGRVLTMVGGRRREQSLDSSKSLGATRSQTIPSSSSTPTLTKPNTPDIPAPAGYGPVESMRTLGNTLNPLKGFAGLRGFGRSSPAPASTNPSSPVVNTQDQVNASGEKDMNKGFDWSGISPPIKRFTELKEPKELTFFDVELLLRDYQRLAGAFVAAGGTPAV